MKKYGLTEKEFEEIVAVLSQHPEIESVHLFGSRALGNFKHASDIDIAVKGKNANVFLTAHLKSQFEDGTNIPYFFDIVDYNTIDNVDLKKHIDEKSVVIYQRNKPIRKINTASWLFLSGFIILLDQFTKYLVAEHIHATQIVHIFPFLNFIVRFNAGAAFSFLGEQMGWQVYALSSVSIVISFALLIWILKLPKNAWVTALSLSFILGGALGNVIDRIRFGFVIDFVDFHVKNWHFATFNVADAAVSVGVVLLILRFMYESIGD